MSRNKSLNFKKLVEAYHAGLYRFAYCLSFDAQIAGDLAQHTFFIYANKGAELHDAAKLKPWFYATLYHEYLRQRTAPQIEPRGQPPASGPELSLARLETIAALDGASSAALFESIEEPLRAPLALFYLRELNYREMAEVLGLPIPELLERVAAGKNRLKAILVKRGQHN